MAERPLTFRERTGLVPMPRQLRTDELTPEIRAQLWAIVYGWMNRNSSYDFLEDDAKRFATQWFVEGMHRPIDEIVPHLDTIRRDLKPLFFARDFYPLFGTPPTNRCDGVVPSSWNSSEQSSRDGSVCFGSEADLGR